MWFFPYAWGGCLVRKPLETPGNPSETPGFCVRKPLGNPCLVVTRTPLPVATCTHASLIGVTRLCRRRRQTREMTADVWDREREKRAAPTLLPPAANLSTFMDRSDSDRSRWHLDLPAAKLVSIGPTPAWTLPRMIVGGGS